MGRPLRRGQLLLNLRPFKHGFGKRERHELVKIGEALVRCRNGVAEHTVAITDHGLTGAGGIGGALASQEPSERDPEGRRIFVGNPRSYAAGTVLVADIRRLTPAKMARGLYCGTEAGHLAGLPQA